MAKDFKGINAGKVKSTIAEATQETQEAPKKNKPRKTYTAQEAQDFANSLQTKGRKGLKLQRINLALRPELYQYVKAMSKAAGMTYTEFLDTVLQAHKDAHEDAYNQVMQIRNIL